ncbi:exodeoxyribonuclease III [Blochmannia endosymbiont of Colobopsis nipponica]|uniref:exodeoxyribonuclease III n=1 Tax=Blochmannia endosymbiont of Colobopsis nipponica TaxID=2681987 RepID=UPI0017845739|nr:exodeoxyribonuclease III [Blochmannia endosymbiont of Colobopsis nipponica]QOI11023.1 exodeoxyribonuclease III [Blochmannia endosymbiont of Colobopsis nipponica]
MRIVSFNINGLRAHFHQLEEIITRLQPNIIALQETKIQDDIFPILKIRRYGYQTYQYGQKNHYGVALLSQQKPISIQQGIIHSHNQKRTIKANFSTPSGLLTVINGYFPQGENRNNLIKFTEKQQFYKNMMEYIKYHYNKNSLLLIVGDMNISPCNLDIGIGKKNYNKWLITGKCSFLPEEREWINNLLSFGLTDVYRYMYPQINDRYSWFDYRSRGFNKNKGLRIDLLLASHPLISFTKDTGINYEIRAMEKSSDHAPIWADFFL